MPGAELLCFLRDAVDTRKAPLMELALDCIQKLIAFKLLQGPVYHINHRHACWRRSASSGLWACVMLGCWGLASSRMKIVHSLRM